MNDKTKNIIFVILFVILLLVSPTGCTTTNSCSILEHCVTRVVEITLEKAIDSTLPLYLPSSNNVKSLGLNPVPIITRKSYDEICSYLDVQFIDEMEVQVGNFFP